MKRGIEGVCEPIQDGRYTPQSLNSRKNPFFFAANVSFDVLGWGDDWRAGKMKEDEILSRPFVATKNRQARERKDSPVQFSLPVMSNASEAAVAAQAVQKAVSEGEVTPLEGATVMGLLEQYRRTLEASEFEKRIEALEAKK